MKTQLVLGVVAALVGILLFLVSGQLAYSALSAAYQNGVNTMDGQISQIVASTEKECKPADIGAAIILSKKCAEKPAETPKK